MGKPRRMRDHRGWAGLTAVAILKPAVRAFTRHEWIDGHKLPAAGGVVVVANHISHVDPITLAHMLHDNGRMPRFLAKAVLFDPKQGIEYLLQNAYEGVALVGTEDVARVPSYHLRGTIAGPPLQAISAGLLGGQ